MQAPTSSLPVTVPSFTLNPVSGNVGTTVFVAITRSNTTFPPGTTTANFGPGISVGGAAAGASGPVVVQPDGNVIATLTISSGAAIGPRTVQVNGVEAITQPNSFTVTAGPAISVTPGSGVQGQTLTVTITGTQTNFGQETSQVSFGANIAVNSVTVTGATSLTANITIAPQAPVGPRTVTVTTGSQANSLVNGFVVLSSATTETLTCRSTAGVPPVLRAEGFTELTGDIVIVCTGGTAGQTSNINIQMFLNVPITSRLVGRPK